jgi:hypothetical protein
MKLKLGVLIVSGCSLMLFAGVRARPLALNRPDFTLPLAYAEAVARLRLSDAVNHAPKDDDLYCVSAKLSTNIAASGEWTFEFSGTNSSRRLVVVTKNGEFFKTMVSRPQP